MIAITTFAGIQLNQPMLSIHPNLPDRWENMRFNFTFKGTHYRLQLNQTCLHITVDKETTCKVNNKVYSLPIGNTTISL